MPRIIVAHPHQGRLFGDILEVSEEEALALCQPDPFSRIVMAQRLPEAEVAQPVEKKAEVEVPPVVEKAVEAEAPTEEAVEEAKPKKKK